MYEQTLDDIYRSLSTDELLMLITAYREDKRHMIDSRDNDEAVNRVDVTIQYLRLILREKHNKSVVTR